MYKEGGPIRAYLLHGIFVLPQAMKNVQLPSNFEKADGFNIKLTITMFHQQKLDVGYSVVIIINLFP